MFLSGTDHLGDRTLLNMLCTRIIEEQVRDVPPSRDMSEFVDLTACRPDDLIDRMAPINGDRATTADENAVGAHDDCRDERRADCDDDDDESDDIWDDPAGYSLKRVADRDALLPRPSRGPM